MEFLIAVALGAAFAWNGVLPLLVVLLGGLMFSGVLTEEAQPWATSAPFFAIVGVVAIVWFVIDRIRLPGWLGLLDAIGTPMNVLIGLAGLTLTMLTLTVAFENPPGVEAAFDLFGALTYGTGYLVYIITRVMVASLRAADRREPRTLAQRRLRSVQEPISIALTMLAGVIPIAGAVVAAGLLLLVWRASPRRREHDGSTHPTVGPAAVPDGTTTDEHAEGADD